MTKNTKRLFFYFTVLIFLILSYVIMLYAQGYKYSFSEGKFQRTGAIALKVNTGAKVFLDDEAQGDTSFFSSWSAFPLTFIIFNNPPSDAICLNY